MDRSADHYALLGVAHDAPVAAIRAAYVARVKAWHPDLAANAGAFDRFREVQEAYHCLRSPERRARYDVELASRAERHLQRMGRAQRRLRKLDRRMPVTIVAPPPVPHWRAAAFVAASGSLVLSACYLFLR